MVNIKVVKRYQEFEVEYEFSISKGIEEIRKINPDFNVRSITVKAVTLHDIDATYGIGFLKSQIPLLFDLKDLDYQFVDQDDNIINAE